MRKIFIVFSVLLCGCHTSDRILESVFEWGYTARDEPAQTTPKIENPFVGIWKFDAGGEMTIKNCAGRYCAFNLRTDVDGAVCLATGRLEILDIHLARYAISGVSGAVIMFRLDERGDINSSLNGKKVASAFCDAHGIITGVWHKQ